MKRTTTSFSLRIVLTVLVLAGLLSSPAWAQRRGGMRIPPQKPRYIKPQRITPNNVSLVEAQTKALEKLKADLSAIGPKSKATPELQAALVQDLMAVVDGSNKPDAGPVKQLTGDLATALANRSGNSLDVDHLARNLKVVMNSAYVPAIEVNRTINTGQTLLKSSGIAATDAQTLTSDLKAIAAQVHSQGQPGMIK